MSPMFCSTVFDNYDLGQVSWPHLKVNVVTSKIYAHFGPFKLIASK